MSFGVNFMTNEKSLLSFSIMSVEWNNERDYIDMIIPFVLNALTFDEKSKVVSITDTNKTLEKEFGIIILNNVLETIFKRLTIPKYGYLKLFNSTFFMTDKYIDKASFENKQRKATENQNYVLKELFKFYDDLKVEYIQKDVENDFIKYLSKYGYSVLSEKSFVHKDPLNIENSRIGRFIENAYNHDSLTFNYIKDIVKGAMLVSSIHMQKSSKLKLNTKFKNTEVYLDTPLLIYALGYSGKAQEETTKELISLLKEAGAVVCFFEHTEDEVKGVLDAYIGHYRNNTLYKSYNYDYLIQENVTALQAEQYKVTLRSKLESMGIYYRDTLSFDSEEVKKISWSGFEQYLNDNIFYNKESRRDNDIKSIVSMYMLRERDNYKRIENCQAIFVTTNQSLVMRTNDYFTEVEGRRDYPSIIDDTLLTSIVWLKCTTCSDELPTMKLISDALAAQEPSKKFWDEFIGIVEKYRDEDYITEEEAIELKYELFCKHNIYQISDGDYKKVTHGTIKETLELNNKYKHKEISDKYEKEHDENNKLKKQLIQECSEKYLKILTISDMYFYLGKLWWLISAIIIFIITAWVSGMQSNISNIITIAIATLIFPAINFLLMVIDKAIDKNINYIESYFVNKAKLLYSNKVKSLVYANYDSLQEEIIKYCIDNKYVSKSKKELESV